MIVDNGENLQKRLVELLVMHMKELLAEQDRVVLGVVGGRSVAAVFTLLREAVSDWHRVHILLLDERLVDYGDVESNFVLLESVLGDVDGINLYPVVKDKVIDGHDQQYTQLIRELGGSFDILLLSSGEDGHVASLFPGHPAMDIADKGFVTIDDSPKPPACRVTATRPLLESAKVGFLMVLGESKADALALYKSDVAVKKCPAKLIQSLPSYYVFTDII